MHGRGQRFYTWVSSVLTIGALLLLAGCSASTPALSTGMATPTRVLATSTPTRPTVPAGTVLYSTDWSHGVANWTVQSGLTASAHKGNMHLDCSGSGSFLANYRSVTANYAVEVPIQVVSVSGNAGSFGLLAQQESGKDGYMANVAAMEKVDPFHGQIQAYIEPPAVASEFSSVADYFPGTKWLTYRVEIRGNQVSFLVNSLLHDQVTSTQTANLSNGPLGIMCGYDVLNLGPLKITAL
jgi:hypothetical protein